MTTASSWRDGDWRVPIKVTIQSKNWWPKGLILLMEELNPAITSWGWQFIYHYLQGFIHPRWFCRISEPSTTRLEYLEYHLPFDHLDLPMESRFEPTASLLHPGELKTAHSKLTQLTRRFFVCFTPKKIKGQMQDLLTRNLWFENYWTLQIDRLTNNHPMWSYSVLSTIQFIGIQDVLFFHALQPKWPERCKKELQCLRDVAGTWLPRNLVCMGILPPRLSTAQVKPYSGLTG